MKNLALFLIIVIIVVGCSTNSAPHEGQKASLSQIYRGTLRLVFADGVEAGRLERPDGTCLGVSLPERELVRLRTSGPRTVSLTGLVSEVPRDIEIATIRINGRVVGFRQCNNKYIFVRKSGDIAWQ